MLTFNLEPFQNNIDAALQEVKTQRLIERIWSGDHTVWKSDPTEIVNRLGWLRCPQTMLREIPEIQAFVEGTQAGGFTRALLLGMGGSSLAPEVFAKAFTAQQGFLGLTVLDTTDPSAIHACWSGLDPERTLVIVSTKSGGTVETLSLFKFF